MGSNVVDTLKNINFNNITYILTTIYYFYYTYGEDKKTRPKPG